MIRQQHKSRFAKQNCQSIINNFKGTFGDQAKTLLKDKKCRNIQNSTNVIILDDCTQQLHLNKQCNSSHIKQILKQNNSINHNTPQQPEFILQQNTEEIDQISQIKFISKQYSSIRGESQNDLDCISDSLAANNFEEDFSPLLDPAYKADQEDFILQIQDIEQTKIIEDNKFTKQVVQLGKITKNLIFNKQETIQVGPLSIGKIKSNKPKDKILNLGSCIHQEIQREIRSIFRFLDDQNIGTLSKSNCANEYLTTELNYLIGSLLNSIKAKGKQCQYNQFYKQFKNLIEDSQIQQLLQILNKNRKRMQRNSLNNQKRDIYQSFCSKKHIQQEDQQFKVRPNYDLLNTGMTVDKDRATTDRLIRMNQKVNMYLLKNNLVNNSKQIANNTAPITLRITKDINIFDISSKKQRAQQQKIQSQPLNQSNLKISSKDSLSFNTSISLRSDSQTITGVEGSRFQLNFLQLNRHL